MAKEPCKCVLLVVDFAKLLWWHRLAHLLSQYLKKRLLRRSKRIDDLVLIHWLCLGPPDLPNLLLLEVISDVLCIYSSLLRSLLLL